MRSLSGWQLIVSSGDSEYMMRLGVSYEFEFNGWSLVPELKFDFVDSEVKTIVSVSFDWKF
jgi:hypothetical protein